MRVVKQDEDLRKVKSLGFIFLVTLGTQVRWEQITGPGLHLSLGRTKLERAMYLCHVPKTCNFKVT